ncbi:hypothetical protein FN846DRAFT_907754 [Sphaerosporella brunnea]|uniref:Uncharacterized protein n=1 Tax=Sphaerosporella brunnea TaxID=1250544 RepID=A0A5J5EVJ6_9PEZI|nr:hypothetical protein FN846DRAFT_907754 [Sphaerosporella brunnea]
MKKRIQDWITQAGQEDIKNMTLVSVALGYSADEPIVLGWTPEASTLSSSQAEPCSRRSSSQCNIGALFSATFIEKSLAIFTRRNAFILEHEAKDEATVYSIVQAETSSRTVQHRPMLQVDPDHLWNEPGFLSGVIARASRRLYTAAIRAATSIFERTELLQLPYGKDSDFMKRMFSEVPPLPFPEMPMTYLARKFRAEWASEAEVRHLEEIVNFRLEAWSYTVSLLEAWVSEGVVEINALAVFASDLIQSSKGTQENRLLLLKCLPELDSLEKLNSAAGIYRYCDCTNFLANIVGLAGRTPPLSCKLEARNLCLCACK